MMDSLALVKYKAARTMPMFVGVFFIFFKSNMVLLGFVHVILFISYYLVTSSIFALLKLDELLG